MKINKRLAGKLGEDRAVQFLEAAGYRIIERNFRCGRLGEIDIIARVEEFLCFIEVKSRKNYDFGVPSEAVNKRKQENIRRLAGIYMNYRELKNEFIRFDIVEIISDTSTDKKVRDTDFQLLDINLITNAF